MKLTKIDLHDNERLRANYFMLRDEMPKGSEMVLSSETMPAPGLARSAMAVSGRCHCRTRRPLSRPSACPATPSPRCGPRAQLLPRFSPMDKSMKSFGHWRHVALLLYCTLSDPSAVYPRVPPGSDVSIEAEVSVSNESGI